MLNPYLIYLAPTSKYIEMFFFPIIPSIENPGVLIGVFYRDK